MRFDLKQIIQTIDSAKEINGKCSKQEYINLIRFFIVYNILLFPLNFVYQRSASIIIFVIIPTIIVFSEIIFILTSIRRLNYFEHKVWWIAIYIIFRGIYLFSLKMYSSQIFVDCFFSLIVTIFFILRLSLSDELHSINWSIKNITKILKLNSFQKKEQENSPDHFIPMLIIFACVLLFMLFPGELKKNIYSKIVNQFDNIIFEITKLDDRIVNPNKLKSVNSNIQSEPNIENKYDEAIIERNKNLGNDTLNEKNSYDPDSKLYQNDLVIEDNSNSTSDVDKNWLLLKHTCDFDLFIDPVPISKTNKSSIHWLLMNYFKNHSMNPKIVEKSKASISYNSEKYVIELQCKKRKERVLLDQYFASQMGKGSDVYSIPANTPEMSIPPKSIDEEAFKYICQGVKIQSGKECKYK